MEQNTQLRTAWDFVENTGRSIFLTGKAGTGKTTFLKTVVERSRKRSVVVAPTGVAAINAGGVTIHSFFQLPFSPFLPNTHIKSKFDFSRDKRRIIASIDLLIIDEISMVRSDLLDAIDAVLRRFRNRYLPFGGVQLLMIGDLQQLTPVVTPEDEALLNSYYDTPYFFGSKALAQTEYVTIQLDKVYRQQDDTFISLLNHIRIGKPTKEDIDLLNSRSRPGFVPRPDQDYIRLTTHNRFADQYNETELERLTTPKHLYTATIEGTFPEYSYPTNDTLELKVGTQVMFVKNDPSGDHLYYNGRIGHVTYLDDRTIRVRCPGDFSDIEVERLTWENAQYTLNPETNEIETKIQGTFSQYPLRLAWAITIHKSQGLTFDHAIIDANRSFAPGQVYVALSRCRTLEGMVLSSPIAPYAIICDGRVDEYIATQEERAKQSITQLPQLKEEYFRYLLTELFDFSALLHLQEQMVRLFIEHFSRSHPQLEQLHKRTLEGFKTQVTDVATKWTAIIRQAPTDQLHSEAMLERVRHSADYFAQKLIELMTQPIRLTADVQTGNKQLRARLDNLLPEIKQTWQARKQLLTSIAEGGFTITHYLKEKQLSLLDTMDDGKKRTTRQKQPKKPKEPKPKTQEVTLSLFRQGLSPKQIAKERGLTAGTIFGHLAQYVATGEVSLDAIITPAHQKAILRIIRMVAPTNNINAIKALCPEDVTFAEIKLMQESLKG